MRNFREDIWQDSEYTYAASYGFMPNIRAYIHDEEGGSPAGNNKKRDAIIVLPGGGYCLCAPHEGQEVALEYYSMGLNAFVLTYTTDITMSVPLKDQPLKDVSRAVRLVRKKYANGGKVIICGFSAASHVCGTLAVHFKDVSDPAYPDVSNRPDGVILSYPVITAGKYTHGSSLEALLGAEATQDELDYYSLEKNVTEDTPPCFLWQTLTDELVPVENSYLFASALKEKGVPYAHYVFPKGPHGIGLAKEPVKINDPVPDPSYALEQLILAVKAVKAGRGINVSDKRKKELEEQFPEESVIAPGPDPGNPHDLSDISRDAGMWSALSKVWMDRL
ncbi:MAG: prolyl oligopeptidase family serine peptidase [Lachnospiraceae bacterium]|nr:prolyl oligopeptidase family serine peptidase [Lachnospiraceae bacterium]